MFAATMFKILESDEESSDFAIFSNHLLLIR